MDEKASLTKRSTGGEVEEFLAKVARTAAPRPEGERGRLIFAMDATASRQPTWDRAAEIQSEMFAETAALGGLEIQLLFYRGFGECKASRWMSSARDLQRTMSGVFCLAGRTQIARVLQRAIRETEERKVAALVFVGDAMEEDLDHLGELAGKLGLLGVPCFLFHEGHDIRAGEAFRQLARLSGGAACTFDAGSPAQLRDLLAAVAVYAAGGRKALSDYSRKAGGLVPLLSSQLK